MTPPSIYIFDFDGTLSNLIHRLHFLDRDPVTGKKDRRSFNESCGEDSPEIAVIDVAKALYAAGHELYLWSGRPSETLPRSLTWLEQQGIDHIFTEYRFRPEGDNIPDDQLKERWLLSLGIKELNRLAGVFDDRKRLVEMYRRHGIKVFQVEPGEF